MNLLITGVLFLAFTVLMIVGDRAVDQNKYVTKKEKNLFGILIFLSGVITLIVRDPSMSEIILTYIAGMVVWIIWVGLSRRSNKPKDHDK